jgi:hypothetical protein
MLSTDGINTTAREEAGYAKPPITGGYGKKRTEVGRWKKT